jgi:hypothetical protein
MDPQFFDRLNALQNLQNQQSNRDIQSELAALREQLAEEANKPQCPHCGGPSEKGFDRCKNCGQEILWIGHFIGKPSERAELEMAMEQYELGIKRQKTETQLLTITYKPGGHTASWFDYKCNIFVDETLIGTGSGSAGATFTTNLLSGEHELSIKGSVWLGYPSYTCKITTLLDEPYAVEFVLPPGELWFNSHISS